MKNYKILIIALSLISVVSLIIYIQITGFYILSPSSKIFGSTLEIRINIFNASDVAGAQLSLLYNKSIVKFVKVVNGSFLNQNGATVYIFNESLDTSTPGLVKDVIMVRVTNPLTGASGQGVLAIFTFNILKSGTSYFNVQDFVLSDSTGAIIPGSANKYSITISTTKKKTTRNQ